MRRVDLVPDAPHGKSGSRNTQVGQDLPTSIRLALPGRDVATTDGLLSLTRGSKGIRPFAGFVHLVVHHPEFDGLESNLDRSDLADEPSDTGHLVGLTRGTARPRRSSRRRLYSPGCRGQAPPGPGCGLPRSGRGGLAERLPERGRVSEKDGTLTPQGRDTDCTGRGRPRCQPRVEKLVVVGFQNVAVIGKPSGSLLPHAETAESRGRRGELRCRQSTSILFALNNYDCRYCCPVT